MKPLAAAFCAFATAMMFSSAIYPQRAAERPDFRVDIRPTGERGASYTVTNLSRKPVWALALEISSSSQPARKIRETWDSIFEGHPPIEPGAAISRPLFKFGRSPLPDKIRVIAVVWTDGETFGAPASVNSILNNRVMRAAEYEDAAGICSRV